MKYLIALFALAAVALANPLPLVQIIVNLDATENSASVTPADFVSIGESPAIAEMPILDVVPEEASYNPLPLPIQPVVVPEEPSYNPLPLPIQPVVVPEEPSYNPLPLPVPQPQPILVPEPVVLPAPVEPVVVPEEASYNPSPLPVVVPEEPSYNPLPVPQPQPIVMPEPIVLSAPDLSEA